VFDYLSEFNPAQREAVLRTEGPALIVAGAGSGKTRVLTYRIAHLLKQGARPSTILALTFTNKAAREMKDRIATVVGPNLSRFLWMGTFHSIFSRILRTEHVITGYPQNFTIYDADDSKSLMRTIIRDLQFDDKTYKPGSVMSRISMAKNNLITPSGYAENPEFRQTDRNLRMPQLVDLYYEYNKRCLLSGAMDFDDLLLKTYILFRDNQDVLKRYQEHFDYILVDEYQDTNYSQYMIIKKLAAVHHNLCVVGDDAQSIYSFRGARIENILNFQHDYPDHRLFKLEQNYRSTQTIVNAANSIIAKNKRQIRKTVYSEKESGNRIRVFSALTDNEEGFIVANEIWETMLRNHYRYDDYAILYRTNAQSRIFEEALRKRNIPYKIYGGLSFYHRKEIKDLLAYFRIIINPSDNEALKRIINYPQRGIGETTVSKLEKTANDLHIPVYELIRRLPEFNPAGLNKGTITKIESFYSTIQEFVRYAGEASAFEAASGIAEKTGILKDLYNDRSPEGLSRHENIQELLNAIQEFSISGKEEGRPDKLENYMEEVSLLTDQDNEKEEDKNRVVLMTIHSAKGLEFRNVFVAGLEENLFPSNNQTERLQPESLEEERRLFYVAVTRAKDNVFLSFASQRYKWGYLEYCTPSRFISEIDAEFVEMPSGMNQTRAIKKPLSWQEEDLGLPARSHTGQPKISPVTKSYLINKINRESQAQAADDFKGDDPKRIQPGMNVEHQRFGIGKVLKTEGEFPDLKAIVFFRSAGQKQLLLRYARLRIVD
jgi:DNA helicase II / ATP-dependent DNA helicase PcrA